MTHVSLAMYIVLTPEQRMKDSMERQLTPAAVQMSLVGQQGNQYRNILFSMTHGLECGGVLLVAPFHYPDVSS